MNWWTLLTRGDDEELKKEVGDLFLHITFQALLAEESGKFSFGDVFDALCSKLINRHPHVFGSAEADTEGAVLRNWESLKMKEGRKRLLDGVPKAMSELLRAYRVQKKVPALASTGLRAKGCLRNSQRRSGS